jgi:hypothetical protein
VDSLRDIQRLVLGGGLPAAGTSLCVGVGLVFVSGVDLHALGYGLCTLLPFVLIALQRREAARVEARKGELRPGWERRLVPLMLAVGIAGAIANAWYFAWAIS